LIFSAIVWHGSNLGYYKGQGSTVPNSSSHSRPRERRRGSLQWSGKAEAKELGFVASTQPTGL